MSQGIFRTRLQKETMVFSAAHFITFNGNICESLHGHNYAVQCEVTGPLDENGYVCDFIALRDALNHIVESLDHKVILPLQHPTIQVSQEKEEVIARFESKRWIFPAEDCQLLPVANTTAELLARYIAAELRRQTHETFGSQIQSLMVGVDENRGQWGIAEIPWN